MQTLSMKMQVVLSNLFAWNFYNLKFTRKNYKQINWTKQHGFLLAVVAVFFIKTVKKQFCSYTDPFAKPCFLSSI